MAVERFTQLKFDEVLDNLDVADEDPQEISQAAKAKFEQLVAQGRIDGSHASSKADEDGRDGCGWFDQYLEMSEKGFPWRVAAYIAWASAPKIKRWPDTQDAFAKQILGLTSDRVITTWRRKNPSIDSTIAQLQSQPLYAHRADIFDALVKSASDPDYKHHQDRKLALEILGDFQTKVKIEDTRYSNSQEELAGKSDTELAEIVAAANKLKSIQRQEQAEDGESNEPG